MSYDLVPFYWTRGVSALYWNLRARAGWLRNGILAGLTGRESRVRLPCPPNLLQNIHRGKYTEEHSHRPQPRMNLRVLGGLINASGGNGVNEVGEALEFVWERESGDGVKE